MNNEEKFKKSLKQMLDSKEFPFDESEWEKAAALIDSNKPKRRVWLYLVLLLSCVGGMITYFSFPENETRAENYNHVSSSFTQSPKNIASEWKQTPNKVNRNTTKKSIPSQKTPSAINRREIKQGESTQASPAPSVQGKTGITTAITGASVVKNNTIKQNKAVVAVPSVFIASVVTPSTPDGDKGLTPNTTYIAPIAILKGKSELIVSEQNAAAISLSNEEKNKMATEIVAASEKPSSKETETASPTPHLAPPDSNSVNKDPLPLVDKYVFTFEAGGAYLFGWKTAGIKEGQGFNPLVGLNYHNQFTDKLDYSLGLQFTRIAHLSAFSDTSKVTHYKLGEESDVTVITPNSLYYLLLPFKMSFNYKGKNTFGIGANLAYLLTSNSTVETYHQSAVISNQNSSKQKGFTEGFSNSNFELSLFYRRTLYKNLSLNTEFVYGLSDIKNNSFFNSPVNERSTGIKISLLYGFIKR